MDQKKLTRGCLLAVGVTVVLLLGLYCIAGSSFQYRLNQTDMLSPTGGTWPLGGGEVVEQRIHPAGDRFTGVTLRVAASGPDSTELTLEIYGDNVLIDSKSVQVGPDVGETCFVPFAPDLDADALREAVLVLRIAARAPAGSGVVLYYGNSVQLGRGAMATDLHDEDRARVNGDAVDGMLCM